MPTPPGSAALAMLVRACVPRSLGAPRALQCARFCCLSDLLQTHSMLPSF